MVEVTWKFIDIFYSKIRRNIGIKWFWFYVVRPLGAIMRLLELQFYTVLSNPVKSFDESMMKFEVYFKL